MHSEHHFQDHPFRYTYPRNSFCKLLTYFGTLAHKLKKLLFASLIIIFNKNGIVALFWHSFLINSITKYAIHSQKNMKNHRHRIQHHRYMCLIRNDDTELISSMFWRLGGHFRRLPALIRILSQSKYDRRGLRSGLGSSFSEFRSIESIDLYYFYFVTRSTLYSYRIWYMHDWPLTSSKSAVCHCLSANAVYDVPLGSW